MKATLVEALVAPTTPFATQKIPAAAKTVRADSLLREGERKLAAKRGWTFGVEYQGVTYPVQAHRQVPVGATVPRAAAGSLIGVAGVTGG